MRAAKKSQSCVAVMPCEMDKQRAAVGVDLVSQQMSDDTKPSIVGMFITTPICVGLSYFIGFWLLYGIWQKALVSAVLAMIVFCVTFCLTTFVVKRSLSLAMWTANVFLAVIFGGGELFALATGDSTATRFGGMLLAENEQITSAGYASLLFDVSFCILCNVIGFKIAHRLACNVRPTAQR